ncbi:MAG TPA: ester cyclase [Anaerolineales bacterium]|nr:ester cyclase [Anaerolineales bacterium]
MFAPGIDIQQEREWLRSIHAVYRDIEYTFLDILAEGDKVAIHWRFSGTHQGEHLGVPPSGNRVTVQGMALIRFVDGKVVEDVSYWDDLSVLNQLRGNKDSG